jgi:hypothetical protein
MRFLAAWGIFPRLALTLVFFFFSAGAQGDWTGFARRLTGESQEVRQEAIASLRKTPNLERDLKRAFEGQDRFLAFDVIVALDLRKMVPALLEFSATDESGYSYHVMNALATPVDRAKILDTYAAQLASAAPAAKVAILDAFARTSRELPSSVLDGLFEHPMPEVRAAALGYVRNAVLRRGRREEARRAFAAILDPAYQIRLQAFYLLSELPAPLRPKHRLRAAVERCRSDPFEAVRTYCAELAAKTEVQ